MKRELLISSFLAQPWALERTQLAALAGMLARWHVDVPTPAERVKIVAMEDDDDPRERISAFEASRRQAQARAGGSAIAVLPLYGTIVQRANLATDICGGTSTQQFTAAFRDAMADDTVGAILIDIDSPGGSVYGTGELADEIRAARGVKPVVAYANSLAASAAYWVGSQASEFYVTGGGEVGSIGVWQAHEDWSKALEDEGVKTTLISAGKFKVEGNPYQPLDGDAQAFMQGRVDDYYAAFTGAVAKGRAVPVDQVRRGMGQGRVLGADAALAEKMVDGIKTFDDVVRGMQRGLKQGGKGASRLARARRRLDLDDEGESEG